MKDSRQRDGDEPVKEAQKSWLRSLVGVLGSLTVADASCGTLARARRVVRYLVHKPHVPWSCPAGTQLEYLDAFADSDWAAKATESKISSCVVIRLGKCVLETSLKTTQSWAQQLDQQRAVPSHFPLCTQ